MSRQLWTETIWDNGGINGAAVANTTTETILFPNATIPAWYLRDGRRFRITARGKISNVVTTPGNIDFKLRWGGVSGTILAQSSAIALSATANTDAMFEIYIDLEVRGNGPSGSVLAIGEAYCANLATLVPMMMGSAGGASGNTPAAVTVALDADTAISLTAHFSIANASNSITGMIFYIEALN